VEAIAYVVPAHTTVNRPADLPLGTQDVSFLGADNLTLRGWYIPPKNGEVIILLHGYFLDRTQMLFHARHLSQAGFGALLYDERGAGQSDGDRRSFGWRDVADVGGALDFLKDKAVSVGISGCSIGGQIALRAAAQYPQIQAVLADGPSIVTADDFPPASSWQESLLLGYYHLVDRLLELYSGMSAPPSLMMTISQIAPRPIMLFAGANGSEKLHIQRYQQAAGANAQYWEIPGATHCDGPITAPDEYVRHMIEFFSN
jgi:pimeloyl-ACP methyl ester carboxylesterase